MDGVAVDRWLVLALLGLAACSGTLDDAATTEEGGRTTAPDTASATASAPTAVPEAAVAASSETEDSGGAAWSVVEVIDGDTLRSSGPGGEERVRMVGINAPEEGECFHREATERLRSLVTGVDVRLVQDESDTDRFGRLLRFVETTDGVDVGAELVRSGFARSQRYEPDVSRNARYDELQAESQAAGRGLWAPDACGSPAATGARIGVEIEYDAPGDDNLNLNEEWVRFTNDGEAPLDLTGWVVADESASHRYRFDGPVLAGGGSVTLFTGCGVDSSTERFWCNRDSAVWNNSGDTVLLRDPQGNTVIAESYRE